MQVWTNRWIRIEFGSIQTLCSATHTHNRLLGFGRRECAEGQPSFHCALRRRLRRKLQALFSTCSAFLCYCLLLASRSWVERLKNWQIIWEVGIVSLRGHFEGTDNTMADSKPTILGGTAIKPKERKGWEAVRYIIHNPETGEIFTRTPKSWLLITVFYLIYYSCLAGFWAAMLNIFFLTLEDHQPKWVFFRINSIFLKNRLIVFRKVPVLFYKYRRIWTKILHDSMYSLCRNICQNVWIQCWIKKDLQKLINLYVPMFSVSLLYRCRFM